MTFQSMLVTYPLSVSQTQTFRKTCGTESHGSPPYSCFSFILKLGFVIRSSYEVLRESFLIFPVFLVLCQFLSTLTLI